MRLTPFEEYMLLDDTDEYPMSFYVCCRFVGSLDREALDFALRDAVTRHPLLRSRVLRQGGRWSWAPTDQPPAAVAWADDGCDQAPLLPRIDLTQRAGLHAAGVGRGQVADICLQIHHSCCDGLGIVQFIRDWFLAYSSRVQGKSPSSYWPPIEPSRLALRSALRMPWFRWPGFLARQSIGLFGVGQFLARRPVPLVPIASAADRSALPAFLSRSLNPTATASLIQQAKSAGVTLNDRVLRDFVLVLQAWREARNEAQPTDWLRISVPINLRGPEDDRLSAANVVSLVFCDRTAADCTDSDALLQSIHQEMQLIKRNALGWTFIGSLALTRLFPGGLDRSVREPRCHATSTFSNLGRIFGDWPLGNKQGLIDCGNMVLENMQFVGPLRHQMNLNLTAHTYANCLRLTARYDASVLSANDATFLLDQLVDRLQQTNSAECAAA